MKRDSIRDTRALPENLLYALDVFIAAARQVDEQDRVARELFGDALNMSDRMGRFERRQDAFEPGQLPEALERLLVGGVRVLGAAGGLQPRVLRPHRGVVQPGGY